MNGFVVFSLTLHIIVQYGIFVVVFVDAVVAAAVVKSVGCPRDDVYRSLAVSSRHPLSSVPFRVALAFRRFAYLSLNVFVFVFSLYYYISTLIAIQLLESLLQGKRHRNLPPCPFALPGTSSRNAKFCQGTTTDIAARYVNRLLMSSYLSTTKRTRITCSLVPCSFAPPARPSPPCYPPPPPLSIKVRPWAQ